MTAPGGGSESALFRAIADFHSLIRQANDAAGALKRMQDNAGWIGPAARRGGGQAETGLGRVARRAAQLGGHMKDTGRSMSVGLTLPVAAVKTFADFDLALTKAGTKTGANSKQLDQMRAAALKMGAETKFSALDAANALDQLAALGFNAHDAVKALPGVVQAASASGEDLAVTTETVARAMNAFGLGAKDSGHVADVFSQAANTTALDMQGIAYGMGQAGEIGSRFGSSLEGTVAWLGRLVDMGVPAASAGAAIRQAMTSLSAPTEKGAGVLADLGIKVRDATGALKQPPELLKELQDGLSTTNPKLVDHAKRLGVSGQAYRDMATKALFGVEGAKAVSLAISDGKPVVLDAKTDTKQLTALQEGLAKTMGGKAAAAWIKAHESAGKFTATGADAVKVVTALGVASDGTAKQMSDRLGKSTAQQIDNLKGSLETLAITVVGTVAPALNGVIGFVTKLVNAFQSLASAHPLLAQLATWFALVIAAAGPLLLMVGSLVGAFSKVASFANVLRGGTGGRFGGAGGLGGGGRGLGGIVAVELTAPLPLPVEVVNAAALRGGVPGEPVPAGEPKPGGPVPVPTPTPVPEKPTLGARLFGKGGAFRGFSGLGFAGGLAGQFAGSAISDGRGGVRDVAGTTVSRAGEGAMAGALFGPAGAAVGATVGAAVGFAMKSAEEAKARADAELARVSKGYDANRAALKLYSGDIEKNSGVVKGNADAITRAAIRHDGLAAVAKRTGLSIGDLTRAVTGSHTAYSRADDVIRATTGLTDQQRNTLGDLRAQFLHSKDDARQFALANFQVQRGMLRSGSAAEFLSGKLGNLNRSHLTGKQAADALRTSQAAVGRSVAENGRTLDLASLFGRRNAAAVSAAAAAAERHAQAVYAQTGSVAAGIGVLNRDRAAIVETARAAGLSGPDVDAFLNRLGLVPADVATRFHVDTAQALHDLDTTSRSIADLQAGIRAIRQGKIPGVTADTAAGKREIRRLQLDIDAVRQARVPGLSVDPQKGLTRVQIFQAAINAIRQNRVPGITANTAAAHARVAELQAQIDRLRSKTVTVTTIVRQQLQGTYNQQVPYAARVAQSRGGELPQREAGGGEVRGRGGPRDDRVPYALLSNREFVTNAQAYAKQPEAVRDLNAERPDLALAALARNLGGVPQALTRAVTAAPVRIPAQAPSKKIEIGTVQVNNPLREPASDSLYTAVQKLTTIGVLGD